MWYEIIPSFAIMTSAFIISGGLPRVLRYVFVNREYYMPKDIYNEEHDILYFSRDIEKTGTVYKPRGLEYIPDPPKEESS